MKNRKKCQSVTSSSLTQLRVVLNNQTRLFNYLIFKYKHHNTVLRQSHYNVVSAEIAIKQKSIN